MMFPKQPKKTYPLGVEGKIHPNFGPTMAGLNLLTGPSETFLYDMAISRLNAFIILYYLSNAAPLLYFHLLWYLIKSSNAHQNIKTLTFLPPKSPHFIGTSWAHPLRQHQPIPSLYSPQEGRKDVFRRREVTSTFYIILHPEQITYC